VARAAHLIYAPRAQLARERDTEYVALDLRMAPVGLLVTILMLGSQLPNTVAQGSPCHEAMVLHSNSTAGKGAPCVECEAKNKAALAKAGCVAGAGSKLSRFCSQPPLQREQPDEGAAAAAAAAAAARAEASEGGDELAWAHELPPPTALRRPGHHRHQQPWKA
jgi:hypothetical protein